MLHIKHDMLILCLQASVDNRYMHYFENFLIFVVVILAIFECEYYRVHAHCFRSLQSKQHRMRDAYSCVLGMLEIHAVLWWHHYYYTLLEEESASCKFNQLHMCRPVQIQSRMDSNGIDSFPFHHPRRLIVSSAVRWAIFHLDLKIFQCFYLFRGFPNW